MILSLKPTREQAQELVRNSYVKMLEMDEAHGGFIPETQAPDLEVAEQREMSRERVRDLREQLAGSSYDSMVIALAHEILTERGVVLSQLPQSRRVDFLSGAARVQIEEQRLFQLRLTDRLAEYTPSDDMFIATRRSVAETQQTKPTGHVGFTVAEAISRYLDDGKRQWVAKTYAARTWQLRFFSEHVGPNLPMTDVTEHHVRTFRDAVRYLHKLHGKMKGASFKQRQTASASHRISDKTASVTYEPTRAFLRWSHEVEGLLGGNPAANVRIVAAKKPKGHKARRNFQVEEIRTLFASPMYTGCRSLHRRYETGSNVFKDAKFWIPVLGYYSGARLGELVQLHIRDVCLNGPVPYLSINEENGSETKLGDRKHVKSRAGVRKVPIHPDVIGLGFDIFVASRAKQKGKSSVRLFDEFAYGSDEQASTVASKWFARFMHSCGLVDPKIVFHSLRHGVEDALRDAQIPKYTIDQIVGHSDTSSAGAYGEGVDLEVAYAAVKSMKLKVSVLEVIAG